MPSPGTQSPSRTTGSNYGTSFASTLKKSDDPNVVDKGTIRRITLKLDRRIIGVMGLVIMIEFLDRVGLGFARIAGIDKDLRLDIGHRFSLVILVASLAQILVQVPMTFLGHRWHPPVFVGSACLGWAATLLGTAFAQRWTDLLPCRILGGAFGAGLSQVTHVLVQTWYPRYEVGRRFAWLSIMIWVSKAIGGITAYGITHMAGVAGLAGWRWIYIWAGILTFMAAMISFVYTVGYADTQRWNGFVGHFLTPHEREIVLGRLHQDRGDTEREEITVRKTLACATDFKFYLFGLIALANHSIMTSLAIFSPMIMHHDFGFAAGMSQALYAPPYIFTALLLILVSELSDRLQHRGIVIVACVLLSILGLVLIGFTTPVAVRYLGLFFANGGLGSTGPLFNAYLANNVRGFRKRSFGTAVLIAFGGIGSIIGSLIFRNQDAPRYLPGLTISIVLAIVMIVVVAILDIYFFIENRKQRCQGKILEGLEDFRYTY